MLYVTSYIEVENNDVTLDDPFGSQALPKEILQARGLQFHPEGSGEGLVALTVALKLSIDDPDDVEDILEALPDCYDWASDVIELVSDPPKRSFADFCEDALNNLLDEGEDVDDEGGDDE